MRRGATAIAVALVGAAMTTPAAADGLGGISGWQPPTAVCGTANVVPLLIGNYTNEVQTAAITIDGDLAEQVAIDPYQSATCPQRTGTGEWGQDGTNYTRNFTVQPGKVAELTISMGGVNENLIGSSHMFTISGLPLGTANAPAYDFTLSLNCLVNCSFENLQATYGDTGGTDPATNTQNGFNILSCNPSAPASGDNVTIGGPIQSPYQPFGSVTVGVGTTPLPAAGPTYSAGEAMCLGWLPEGTMVTSELQYMPNGTADPNAPISSVLAAQVNETLGTGALVFDASGPVTGIEANGVSLPQTPGSPGGYWFENNDRVIVEGFPLYQQTTVGAEGSVNGLTVLTTVEFPLDAAGPADPAPSLIASDLQVQTSTPNFDVDFSANVAGVSGTSALIDVTGTVLTGYDGQNVYLVQVEGPSGQTTAYNTLMGPATLDATLTKQISIPIPVGTSDSGGYFPPQSFTATFVLAPTSQQAGEYGSPGAPSMQTWTLDLSVSSTIG